MATRFPPQRAGATARPAAPADGARRPQEPERRARWWRELALAAGLYVVYNLIHGAVGGGAVEARHHGRDLLRWETALHLDVERVLNRALLDSTPLAVTACYFYAALHFLVTPAVLIWTFALHERAYAHARNILATLTFAALIGFWAYPVAPPRLLHGAGFVDIVARYHSYGWWSGTSSVPAAARAFANPFAAMPSLHMAWACWCAATVFALARRRWIRGIAVAYPVVTAAVVLATANHYLLDVLTGVALWLLVASLARTSGRVVDRQRTRGALP